MTTTRRGFLKSFVAAAGMAIARHYAPAALATPKVMPQPLPVATILHRMCEALEKIPKGGATVFWMSSDVYRRLVTAVRGSSPSDHEQMTSMVFNDRHTIVERIIGAEIEESGALLSMDRDGGRSIVDVETGILLRKDDPPPKPHFPFGRGFK